MSALKRLWEKAPPSMRDFNGLVCSTKVAGAEYGVFKEKHRTQGCAWALRRRPLFVNGSPRDSWGAAHPMRTKREALACAEKIIEGHERC